jgi:putative ABC transport system permease protein
MNLSGSVVTIFWRLLYGVVGLIKLLGMAFLLGLSLLPLASLLLMVPAVQPDESVLVDSTARNRSFWQRLQFGRRLFAIVSGFIVLIALVATATEVVSHLPLHAGYFSTFARGFLPDRLERSLPPTMIDHWPEVLLLVYLTDLLLLFAIGKVPLGYNLRNLVVRWKTTLLTGFAFTVVVALLVVMLAFVNGVHALTEASGDPSNVFILSDAATDEIFSNLGSGKTIDKLVELKTNVDRDGKPLGRTVGVKRVMIGDTLTWLMSKETYSVLNMPVPNPTKGQPQRRFIQLRAIDDANVASIVHNIELSQGRWFSDIGSKGGVVESVIGEGLARTLGADVGKESLQVGDQFDLALNQYEVVGIMKSDKTTFGSELWAKWSTLKDRTDKDTYSTVVLRVDEDTGIGADAFSRYLEKEFRDPKVKAVPETKYYSDLAKSNKQFLYAIMLIAAVMAIGGVFGVMNTMFAAIAQRTKDIGVLRILGFKRWQILVSFMLESLGIALLGGMLGCALGSFADGFSSRSIMTAGMGGGKSVMLKLTIDLDVILCGILFTFAMGRLGGLLPSLSAMRLGILDTLK